MSKLRPACNGHDARTNMAARADQRGTVSGQKLSTKNPRVNQEHNNCNNTHDHTNIEGTKQEIFLFVQALTQCLLQIKVKVHRATLKVNKSEHSFFPSYDLIKLSEKVHLIFRLGLH